MFVTSKRLLPDYEKDRAATDEECVIDVKDYMKMSSVVNNAYCPVCHGDGLSKLIQCQAIRKDGEQCSFEALNLINGTNNSKYYLCGKHFSVLIKRANSLFVRDGEEE